MPRLILTRQQVRQVDQRAIRDFGMTGLVLMENAGRGCADLLCRLGITGPVVICCGKGNNGGDGFVIARHLDARGYQIKVLLACDPVELGGDAAENYAILLKSGVPIFELPLHDSVVLGSVIEELTRDADWIVDALLGTGASGPPRLPIDTVIKTLNAQHGLKLAVDLPSGLDCDTGMASAATFRADHTCTFVAAKPGLLIPSARAYVGELAVIDIGVPRKLIDELAKGD